MSKDKKEITKVKRAAITILSRDNVDCISLADMLRAEDGDFFISDWPGSRNTVAFFGISERIYIDHPDFNSSEFATNKMLAGMNRYALCVKESARGKPMHLGYNLQEKRGRTDVPQSPNFGRSFLK